MQINIILQCYVLILSDLFCQVHSPVRKMFTSVHGHNSFVIPTIDVFIKKNGVEVFASRNVQIVEISLERSGMLSSHHEVWVD